MIFLKPLKAFEPLGTLVASSRVPHTERWVHRSAEVKVMGVEFSVPFLVAEVTFFIFTHKKTASKEAVFLR
tara:strand:+ start:139828 stop:140040 length:213 start_codon:yes stop_codon:yes gene_type:complete